MHDLDGVAAGAVGRAGGHILAIMSATMRRCHFISDEGHILCAHVMWLKTRALLQNELRIKCYDDEIRI